MSNTALSNINSTVLQFLESNNISNQDLVSLWMENDVQNKLKANIKSKSKSLESKRKPSAYLLFCQEHRAKVKDFLLKENPDLKSFQVTQRLGQMWKSLKDDPNRAEELKTYQNTANSKKEVPSKPKRGKSSYLYFCNDFRETVKNELQKQSGIEPKATTITKELGLRWNKLKADGNIAKYEEMAVLDKKRYYEEKGNTNTKEDNEVKEVVKEVKKDTTTTQKTNNYQNFCNVKRPLLKKSHPNKKPMEITKLIATQWKNLSVDEQNKY